MAPRERVKAQRAATPDDLKSLVQALGGLVRESVREEVAKATAPLERTIEALRRCVRDTVLVEKKTIGRLDTAESEAVVGDTDKDPPARDWKDRFNDPNTPGASS